MKNSLLNRQKTGRKKGTLNKTTFEIRKACALHGEEMISALLALARGSEGGVVRLGAIKEMLDRGFGKSAQPVEGTVGGPPIAMTITWAGGKPPWA